MRIVNRFKILLMVMVFGLSSAMTNGNSKAVMISDPKSINAVRSDQLPFIGYAFDKNNETLLYSEEHSYLEGQRHKVIYKEPDGNVFAEKYVSYQASHIAPEIQQVNNRNGEFIDITHANGNYLVHYKENASNSLVREQLESSESLVIDAGFDQYIQQNWQSLVSGEAHQIQYVLPSRQQVISLNIKTQACKHVVNQCFIVNADNWLFRLLSKPLNLIYDSHSMRLMSFDGRSNIADAAGEYQDVVIRYHYQTTNGM